jgi:hypothetical protein
MFTAKLFKAFITSALATLTSCATSTDANRVTSEHVIIGPKGYRVDWGLPETAKFWIPNETVDEYKVATETCKAPHSLFVWYHMARPPWFSGLGLNFPVDTEERQKSCVVTRLKAVPALTVYPKHK